MTVHELYLTEYSVKDKAEAFERGRGFVYLLKSGRLKPVRRTVKYIANSMVTGRIVNFSEAREKSLILVDLDNKSEAPLKGHEAVVDYLISIGLPPAAMITTFSSTKDHPRYHVLFALDQPLDSGEVYRNCIKKIVYLLDKNFGTGTADYASATSTRIFFPGREIVYSDYKATVRTMDLIMISCDGIKDGNMVELDLDAFLQDSCEVLGINSPYPSYSLEEPEGHIVLNKAKQKILCLLSCTGTFRPPQEKSQKPLWLGRFRHVENLFSKLTEIDLSGVLRKPPGVFFEDIFQDHDEDTGRLLRAVISRSDDGRYGYHVYDRDRYIKSYDIYELACRIFGLGSVKEAYRMISVFLKVSGKPLVTAVLLKRLKKNRTVLGKISSRSYRYLNRYLSCNSGSLRKVLETVLEKAITTAGASDMYKSCNQFWITRESLGLKGNVAYNKLKMLIRLGLIKEVPEKSYSFVIKKLLAHRRHKNERAFVITIPEYDEFLLEEADAAAEKLLADGFNESNLEYEGKYDKEAGIIINSLCIRRDLLGTEYILLNDFCRMMEKELALSEKRRLTVIRTIISTVGEGRGIFIKTLTASMQKKYGITEKVYPGVTKIILLSKRKEQINAR